MTLSYVPPFWEEAPFARLLIPLLLGIIVQQEHLLANAVITFILILSLLSLFFFNWLSHFLSFRFNWIRGIIIHLCLFATGYLIAFTNDGSNDQKSILNQYSKTNIIRVTIQQPLEEKLNSYKTIATAEVLFNRDSIIETNGKLILYFAKKQFPNAVEYGSQLLISKPLQVIRNSGNPGAFDYEAYCHRQHIYYSVFLSTGDYRILKEKIENPLQSFVFAVRKKVVGILASNIRSNKESGFAKALLIGYTDDLDKSLVQSYSNTGVVHIIAISGLHLGIIFGLLDLLVSPLKKKKYSRWLSLGIILAGLWGFSFLAGAGPSVIRSACMFSFVVLGKTISKQSNILNNLAASAFILLCIHPFWLWDAGFQLSYAAVLSIVLFFKPIYHWFYFPNKIVDFAWKLNAVTLSAQVLTIPICIYQFHQLPTYFFLSNFLAVPWSSLILLGEILLCCIAFLPTVASILGLGLQWMIFRLNDYIDRINALPFAVWSPLQISTFQLVLIFAFIIALSMYLMRKKKSALMPALLSLLVFVGVRSHAIIKASLQQKIIVYNMPHSQAIDFINGRSYLFIGDDVVNSDKQMNHLYLQPCRSLFHVLPAKDHIQMQGANSVIHFANRIVLVEASSLKVSSQPLSVDILIMSKDSHIDFTSLIHDTHPKLIVADASNHTNKRNEWRKICNTLRIPFHDVTTDGALQYDLN